MKDIAILLTDVFSRKTFDLSQIVRKIFPYAETLIASEHRTMDLIQLRPVYPHATFEKLTTRSYNQFEQSLSKIASRHKNQKIVFLPIEEHTIILFYKYIKINGPGNFLFTLPAESVFDEVRDKGALMSFCEKNGIPHPRTYSDLIALNKLEAEHRLISKPVIGEGSKGILRFNRSGVDDHYFHGRVVQDEIKATEGVIGVFLHCKEGQVSGHYCHQRLRTFPQKGGVTVLSEVVESERCLALAKQVVSKLNWNGLIMLEFLYDSNSNEYLLLEINPRLWGSLLLSEAKSKGLISHYINELIGIQENLSMPDVGYQIRWVFPYDILYLISGKINLKEFFSQKDTLFVNWTYAPKFQALIFIVLSILDFKKWKALFKKI